MGKLRTNLNKLKKIDSFYEFKNKIEKYLEKYPMNQNTFNFWCYVILEIDCKKINEMNLRYKSHLGALGLLTDYPWKYISLMYDVLHIFEYYEINKFCKIHIGRIKTDIKSTIKSHRNKKNEQHEIQKTFSSMFPNEIIKHILRFLYY